MSTITILKAPLWICASSVQRTDGKKSTSPTLTDLTALSYDLSLPSGPLVSGPYPVSPCCGTLWHQNHLKAKSPPTPWVLEKERTEWLASVTKDCLPSCWVKHDPRGEKSNRVLILTTTTRTSSEVWKNAELTLYWYEILCSLIYMYRLCVTKDPYQHKPHSNSQSLP